MTSIAVADWTFATYTYGANNGQLQSMTYGNGNKVTYTYDILGRVKTEKYYETVTASQPVRTLSYTYTGDGQLYCVHDTETNEYQYFNYDTLGRLISSKNSNVRTHNWYNAYNQLTKWEYTSPLSTTYETYTYDTSSSNAISDGKLTSMRMVSGDSIDYQYDALQRLTYKHINSTRNGDGVWERYTYSGSQVTGKKNWKNDTVATHDFTYTYDSVGNILTETDSINSTSVTYTYDELSQLTGVTRNGKTESYTYDSGGNITSFNNGNGISHTLVYDDKYNGNMGWGDLLRTVDGQTITYDDIGNPLSYYNGYRYTMTWEQGRQLASVTYNNKTTTYQYNSDGIRTKKIKNDGSYVIYHLANGKAIGETHFDANNAAQYYLRYTFDETGSVVGFSHWGTNGHWQDYYFVKNLQGDVLKVYLASNDAEVASYTYDSWGNILTSSGSFANINPFRYRTYYYDSETWFYYLQSRYYDPSIGRFINADAFVSTGQGILGYNMFAYCNNNPVNMTDSTGKLAGWIILGILLGSSIIGGILGATTDKNLAQNAKDSSIEDQDLPSTPKKPVKPNKTPILDETDSLTQPSNDQSLPETNNELSTQDRLNNIIIGASAGLMVGGATVFLGGAGLCIAGYATAVVPLLGMTGLQTAAWGMIAFDVFPIFIGPFLGMEIEPLEYPS